MTKNCCKGAKRHFLGSGFFALLFCMLSSGIFAQETKAALGTGPEWNMNSRKNFAAGAVLGFDYNLPHSFALGLAATGSSNFSGFIVIEPSALFRWYFLGGYGGFFAQADLGCFLILEDGELTPMLDGGVRAGYRALLGKSFYVEPYGRIGYPFAFGVGVMAGLRFGGAPAVKKEKEILFAHAQENIVIEKTKGGKTVRLLNAVYFEPDSAVMIEKYQSVINAAGERLKADPSLRATVRAYAAPFGTAEGRAEIAALRGRFCADYLKKNYGVADSRIKMETYGAEKTPEFKDSSWESYRCVELIIEGK